MHRGSCGGKMFAHLPNLCKLIAISFDVTTRRVALVSGAFTFGISGLAERAASREFTDAGIDGRQIAIFWIKDSTIPSDESFALWMARFRHGL
jgi:hypothetical protein